MNGVLTTVPAHYDGSRVCFDAKIELEPNTRLLVVILDDGLLGPLSAVAERKRQLAVAAETLLSDYAARGELTAFTALDGEDFYA